ncbi:hypothetical protein [Winogradskyella sediminis]|uniref:Peptidase family M50 n=1 Tax=Winogradskyella sediminis TaxID=1382466 RepID=A0A1H1WQA4_9FLAO|nr:hypothetical protein [Winogradskyella sediminis]SDS98840.1 hypothetical protein SAMN04489797_2945 [Winogradskyella sediminis]
MRLRFKVLPKFSIVVCTAFILFTVIGTLSHELGHITVAKYLGYDTTLDFGSMSWYPKGYLEDPIVHELNTIVETYDYNNYEDWPEEITLKVESLSMVLNENYPIISETDNFYITLGGPIQTLLTSGIGLLILYLRRKVWCIPFQFVDGLAVMMALFALREVFNYVHALYDVVCFSETEFMADEFKISRYLGYNEWLIPSVAMIIGVLISAFVIFKILPVHYRFTFILSGFIGGIVGYGLWFGGFGAMLFNSNICL